MTAKELHAILEEAISTGQDDVPIYFDTDARTFEYHMAKIGRAYLQELADGENTWVILDEERYK